MKRDFLFAYYQTPRGKLLKELEVAYLRRSITVSCQQSILQIGGLGCETEFIDCSLYQYFAVVDAKKMACQESKKIQAKSFALPIQSDSIDLIIVPHLLEFDASRFQTFRELERVLKPEGMLIVMTFNPLNLWLWYQFLLDKKLANSWRGHFISRSRLWDWLKILNFEVLNKTEFYLNADKTTNGFDALNSFSFTSNAYAIKAIKRRFNPIPMSKVHSFLPNLAAANPLAANLKYND